MTALAERLGTRWPLIQAPMAGSQGSALALAVSGAGGLGSLPAAMLAPDALRAELQKLQASGRPYNVNFFCHTPPAPDAAREAAWQQVLAPYYRELGVDPAAAPAGPARRPFDEAAAELLAEFRPPVVSFHFGLPAPGLLARVKAWGAFVLSSATTVREALWLQEHGADAVIAQGLEAGGHRGHFLSLDVSEQSVGHLRPAAAGGGRRARAGDCRRRSPAPRRASRPGAGRAAGAVGTVTCAPTRR